MFTVIGDRRIIWILDNGGDATAMTAGSFNGLRGGIYNGSINETASGHPAFVGMSYFFFNAILLNFVPCVIRDRGRSNYGRIT